MKNAVLSLLTVLLVAGCSKSEETPEPPTQQQQAAAPVDPALPQPVEPAEPAPVEPVEPVETAVVTDPPATPETVDPAPPAETEPETGTETDETAAKGSFPQIQMQSDTAKRLAQLTSSLLTSEDVSGDATLKDVTQGVARSVLTLGSMSEDDPTIHGVLQESLTKLSEGKDVEAMEAASKVYALRVSSQQIKMAKQAENMISAFAAQRNFSQLPQGQFHVSRLVNALRYGDMKVTFEAAKNVMGHNELNTEQQAVLAAIMNRAKVHQQ